MPGGCGGGFSGVRGVGDFRGSADFGGFGNSGRFGGSGSPGSPGSPRNLQNFQNALTVQNAQHLWDPQRPWSPAAFLPLWAAWTAWAARGREGRENAANASSAAIRAGVSQSPEIAARAAENARALLAGVLRSLDSAWVDHVAAAVADAEERAALAAAGVAFADAAARLFSALRGQKAARGAAERLLRDLCAQADAWDDDPADRAWAAWAADSRRVLGETNAGERRGGR